MPRVAPVPHVDLHREARARSGLAISERRLLLITGDLLLTSLSIIGSLIAWSNWAGRALNQSLWQEQAIWACFLFVGWGLWFVSNDMYNLRRFTSMSSNLRRISAGGIAIALAYLILFFVISPRPLFGSTLAAHEIASSLLPRMAPAMAIVSSTVLLLMWRATFVWGLSGPIARRRVLILGAGKAGTTVCGLIKHDHSAHYDVIGFVDDDQAKQHHVIADTRVLGGHTALSPLARHHHIDEVVVAISAQVHGSLFQSLMDCYEQGVSITPMPLLYERLTGKIAVEHIGSQWYIALPLQQHAAGHLLALLKRCSDILFGLLAAVVFAVLYPIIALAIRLDSDGPVFYLQERAGLHGQSFRVRKFRSMIANAEREGQAQWAVKGDQRITRVGKFLRKTRLDELPQVINVLRGEMSLVGPRPERPQFIDQLQYQIPFYRTRLATKPGLTGWAQVNYGYGSTVEDALIKLQYDLYYIKHQSPWLDLLIVLRTISVVLRMKGQ